MQQFETESVEKKFFFSGELGSKLSIVAEATNLLEWKHFMFAEFSTDTHTWFVDDTIFVIGLPSVDILILFSTYNIRWLELV